MQAPSKGNAAAPIIAPKEHESGVQLKDLFNYNRVRRPVSFFQLILLALYFPFGCLLVVLRVLILLPFAVLVGIIPSTLTTVNTGLLNLMALVCGIVVVVKNSEKLKVASQEPTVIVSNHLTNLDGFMMRLLMPVSVLIASKYRQLRVFTSYLSLLSPIFVDADHASVRENIQKHIQQNKGVPLFMFPEGGLTNGRVGLMVYQQFVFSLGTTILPLAMDVSTPLPIEFDTMSGTALTNWIWFFWRPYILVTIQVLTPQKIGENETAIQFANRVQRMTAEKVGLVATNFTYKDKVAFSKSKAH